MATNPTAALRALLASVLAAGLAGCPGESEPESREPETRERVETPASRGIAARQWLEPADTADPALWLAAREEGRDLAPDAPAVTAWRARLAEADARFGETGRMIANRAAQLETMLAEIGVRESAREILETFTPFAEKGSRRGFSDLCQHYYNLRTQGFARPEAVAALKAEPVRAEPVAPAQAPSPAAPGSPSPAGESRP